MIHERELCYKNKNIERMVLLSSILELVAPDTTVYSTSIEVGLALCLNKGY